MIIYYFSTVLRLVRFLREIGISKTGCTFFSPSPSQCVSTYCSTTTTYDTALRSTILLHRSYPKGLGPRVAHESTQDGEHNEGYDTILKMRRSQYLFYA